MIGDYLKTHGLTFSDLDEWGITYDALLKRIVMPVRSLSGSYVLDVVRNLDGEPKFDLRPKGCRTSCVLYGLNRTSEAIQAADLAIVVEGVMNALAVYKFGVPNVCAVLTASLSRVQLALLLSFASKLIVFADGDEAGKEFARKSTEMSSLVTGIIVAGHDPPSFAASGGNLRSVLQQAGSLYPRLRYVEFSPQGDIANAIERDSIDEYGA